MDRFEQKLDRKIEEVTTSGVVNKIRAKSPIGKPEAIEDKVEDEMKTIEKSGHPKDKDVKKAYEKKQQTDDTLNKSIMKSVLDKELAGVKESFDYERDDLDEAVDKVFDQYYGYMSEDQD